MIIYSDYLTLAFYFRHSLTFVMIINTELSNNNIFSTSNFAKSSFDRSLPMPEFSFSKLVVTTLKTVIANIVCNTALKTEP